MSFIHVDDGGIDKVANMDFSAVSYKLKMLKDKRFDTFELIPESMDFLHELTDIFPLENYDIQIVQHIFKNRHRVSPHFDITNKHTGKAVPLTNSTVVSDNDYHYLLQIYVKDMPQIRWSTAEEYLRDELARYAAEDIGEDLFTDESLQFLRCIAADRYSELKSDGYVDFDPEHASDLLRDILEDALRRAYELRNEGR